MTFTQGTAFHQPVARLSMRRAVTLLTLCDSNAMVRGDLYLYLIRLGVKNKPKYKHPATNEDVIKIIITVKL